MANRQSRSKARSANAQSARRAAARAELQRAQARARLRGRLLLAGGVVVAVALIAVAIVVVGLRSHPEGNAPSTAADSSVVSSVTNVPASVLDKVGAGSGIQRRPAAIDAPALTADGKPRVLYVGAEYCPYCAAERWAVVAALSRFGSFSGLGQTASSGDDIYPNTATLSFHGARYTSRFLSFTGVEIQSNTWTGNGYAPLDKLQPADQKILDTYDTSAHTGSRSGSIPFLDLGGRYVSAGSAYDPGLLQGMSHRQIADALRDPDSKVAAAIDGTANILTADLCRLTGQKPASVCSSSGVRAAR